MFTISVKTVQKNPEFLKELKKRAQAIARKKVAIGFPKGKLNAPHYEPKGNEPGPSIIDVAIWNNFGLGVPRRDFMTPATQKWEPFCEETVESLKEDIISGKINIDDVLGTLGQKGASLIANAIEELKDPPNAPVTIHGGLVRTKSGEMIEIKGKGSANPLIDSGDMRRAVTYEIRTVEK